MFLIKIPLVKGWFITFDPLEGFYCETFVQVVFSLSVKSIATTN